jgi:hypothetical protein
MDSLRETLGGAWPPRAGADSTPSSRPRAPLGLGTLKAPASKGRAISTVAAPFRSVTWGPPML